MMKRSQRSRFGGINAQKTPWLFVSVMALPKDAPENTGASILQKRHATVALRILKCVKTADSEHRMPDAGKRKVLLQIFKGVGAS